MKITLEGSESNIKKFRSSYDLFLKINKITVTEEIEKVSKKKIVSKKEIQKEKIENKQLNLNQIKNK